MKRRVESDESVDSSSDILLCFREEILAFFRIISGKQHLSILPCLHVRITNGINNGDPKNIRSFETMGIFWIMLKQQ